MTLTISNMLDRLSNKETLAELLATGEKFIDADNHVTNENPEYPDMGIAHDIPSLTRMDSGNGDYFSPYFTINGWGDKEDWSNDFADALAVGLTILNHAKEFNGGAGTYQLMINSEQSSEPESAEDYMDEDGEMPDDMSEFVETDTHLFIFTLNANGDITLEHGRNSANPKYGVTLFTGDPIEFIAENLYRYA